MEVLPDFIELIRSGNDLTTSEYLHIWDGKFDISIYEDAKINLDWCSVKCVAINTIKYNLEISIDLCYLSKIHKFSMGFLELPNIIKDKLIFWDEYLNITNNSYMGNFDTECSLTIMLPFEI